MTTQDAASLPRARLAVVRRAPAMMIDSISCSSTGAWDDETPLPSSGTRTCTFRPAEVGDLLDGRFLLERMAGSGGMGEVYEAIDTTNGARVAIKVLSAEGLSDMARFEREALVLASFQHPGIVGYVAHGGAPNPYLAMEWLDGEDLSRRVAQKPLTLAEAIALGIRVGNALGELHARGVIHRDIKPANIYLPDGDPSRAKILDLGLARVGMLPALTKAGTVLGTLGYVAPEQAQQAFPLDARADVYSLGCVLYKCLTGKAVFAAGNMLEMISKILYEEAPSLRAELPDAPAELVSLVARMLAKNPDERPADARAVVAELSKFVGR